jgi:multicomponent Na+:H+ antiporter subunit F
VNVWLIGATALLAGLVPCGWVCLRAPTFSALVGLELAGTVVVLALVLLAQGFHRSVYFVLPLVLAVLRTVHSGVIGDYVAWLTAGTAALLIWR